MCTPSCKVWFHLVVSAIGIIIGFSAAGVFFCGYKNFDAGLWGFFSGVFAAVCFHLHYLHYRQTLNTWHSIETVGKMKVLAVLGIAAGVAGFAWYIFQALYYDIPVMPVRNSMYIAAVWTFMTAKWGLMLFISSRMYVRILSGDEPILIRI